MVKYLKGTILHVCKARVLKGISQVKPKYLKTTHIKLWHEQYCMCGLLAILKYSLRDSLPEFTNGLRMLLTAVVALQYSWAKNYNCDHEWMHVLFHRCSYSFTRVSTAKWDMYIMYMLWGNMVHANTWQDPTYVVFSWYHTCWNEAVVERYHITTYLKPGTV